MRAVMRTAVTLFCVLGFVGVLMLANLLVSMVR
jgi:hypothetical protein